MNLEEAIDEYSRLSDVIAYLNTEREECENIIRSNIEAGKHHEGTNTKIFMKPGNKRFTGYIDTQFLTTYIIGQGLAEDCMKLDRTAINKAVFNGDVEAAIKDFEIIKQNKPSIICTPI